MAIDFMSVGNALSLRGLKNDPTAAIPASLLDRIEDGDQALKMPTKLQDLVRERTYGRVYSSRMAAKLGFPVADLEGSADQMVHIHEYMKYVELHDEDERALYGIAIRWVTEFSKWDAKVQTLSLPFITANVEAGNTHAWSRFEVVGMSSKKITENLPSSEALRLDMESYIRLQDAFDRIKGLIWDQGNTIHPQVLAIFGEISDFTSEDYEEALAIGWALTRIKERKTHGDTLDEYKDGSARFNEIVERIYANMLGADKVATKPSEEAKRAAEALLSGFKVER